MHAPSLARVIDGNSGGLGRRLRGRDTARLDASLHDVIRSVPGCCYPRIQGLPEYMTVHMLGGAPLPIHVQCVGLNLGRETKWFKRGSPCKVRQDVGKNLLFLGGFQKSCMSRRWPVGARSST